MKNIGEVKSILGINVTRDRVNKCMYLDQSKYIQSVLKQFNMSDAKPQKTPLFNGQIEPNTASSSTPNIPYAEAVGSLIYACNTRPDITYATNIVCKFMSNYNDSHWIAVKRILRYLKGTIDQKLLIDGRNPLVFKAYCDADFGNDASSRKSYSGYVMTLCDTSIAWSCQQQKITALSTTEAEYIAISYALREILHFRNLLNELLIDQSTPTILYCDNQGAIALSNYPNNFKLSKHIDIRYHRIRDEIERNNIVIQHIDSNINPADIMTKVLLPSKHETAVELLKLTSSKL